MVREAGGPFQNIEIVLVKPLRAGNIGSAARAMKNMGFSKLSLVNPCDYLVSEAYQMAYGAHDILEGAIQSPSLAEALSKARFVVGLTGHNYQHHQSPLPFPVIAPEILSHSRRHTVSILFGSESTGLTQEEVTLCQRLAVIPTGGKHTSLNLAQAVMVVLYELFCAGGQAKAKAKIAETHPLAPVHQTERFYEELNGLLKKIGFIKGRQGRSTLLRIRNIFSRTGLTLQELRLLRGIIHEVLLWMTHRKGEKKKKN